MSEVRGLGFENMLAHYLVTDDGAEVAVTVANGGHAAFRANEPTVLEMGTPPDRHFRTEALPPIRDPQELEELIGKFAAQSIRNER